MVMRNRLPIILALMLAACTGGELDLNLQVESAAGLRSGSPVLMNGQIIGQINALEPDAAGGSVAKIAIKPEFRAEATETARFVIARDPGDPDQRHIELKPGAAGAPQLAEDATVRASIEPQPLFPLGEMLRSFTEGLGALRDQVERFRLEMQRLPQSEEAKRLQEEWARLKAEMQQAQEATDEAIKKEVIPRLKQEMDALEKRFREMDRKADPKGHPI